MAAGGAQEEVIRLKLDNSSFMSGVNNVLNVIDKLKNSLNFSRAGQSIDEVGAKASKFSLAGMGQGVDQINAKFVALSTIAITALTNITNRAVNAGLQMAKSFTIGPIAQGFQDYETQINAIQTVLANTGLEGADGIAKVNAKLDELNHYADKTIYSFPEMAKNIGTFTAAGVGLDQSVNAIKGIANLAAVSGSNSQQASTAMYQLSQAIAQNKVGLMDWNSVVNAGMGGKIFQNALFNTAKLKGTLQGVNAGTTFDEWTKAGNSFRDSLQEGWITGEVLTDTLSQFTGDLSDAQLKSMGYNDQQIAEVQKLAKVANNAATQVKTFSQLKDTLKESVGSAYAGIFRTLFGDIGEATGLFTGLSNVLQHIFADPVTQLGTFIQRIVDLGGKKIFIDAIVQAFNFLKAVIAPIKAAFREVFPAKSAQDITVIIQKLDNFARSLIVSGENADKIKRTFAGLFSIFGIASDIIKAVAGALGIAFKSTGQGASSFLSITAAIGDFLVKLRTAINDSTILPKVFNAIGNAIRLIVAAFGQAGDIIQSVFDKLKPDKAAGTADSLNQTASAADKVSSALGRATEVIQNLSDRFAGSGEKIKNVFDQIGDKIAQVFGSQSFDGILKTFQTGLLAGIVVYLKRFMTSGFNVDIGSGFLEKFGEALEGVTGQLQAMQMNLKATALLKVAAAIGILALSLLILSYIPPDKLSNAMAALGLGLLVLVKAVGFLSAMLSGPAAAKIVFASTAIGLLAVAVLILAGAMLIFAHMSWEEIAKGLAATVGLLLALSGAVQLMSAGGIKTLFAGAGILVLAVALNILAGAVKIFSTMSWGEMLQGLAGIGIALVGIGAAMYLFPPTMPLIAAGLLILSVALTAIVGVVKLFSMMSWEDIGKGLAGIAGSLIGIGVAVSLMPPTLPLIAIGLIGVSLALGKIAEAVGKFGGMSWGEIAKGLVGLGGSLLILAAGLIFMSGTLAGAAALVVAAVGLSLFVPIIKTLSKMSWGDVAKGIGILAIALGGLALIAVLLQPFTGAMLSLGAALTVVGIAVLLFGAGIALLGVGLGLIAASGGAAIAVIIANLDKLGDVIPRFAISIGKGIVTLLQTILDAAPQLITGLLNAIKTLLDQLPTILPSLVTALTALVNAIIQVLKDNVPNILQAGFELLQSLLTGIKNNIGSIVTSVGDIIVAFLNALGVQLPRIVDAGVDMLFQFLEGVAQKAGEIPGEVIKIIGIFINSLVENFPGVNSTGKEILNKLIEGITSMVGSLISTATNVGSTIINGIKSGVGSVVDFVKGIINGIVGAFSDVSSIVSKAISVGNSIVSGILNGIGDIASAIWNKVKGGLTGLVDKATSFLNIGGPSMLMSDEIGRPIGLGIEHGIEKQSGAVADAAVAMTTNAMDKMKNAMGDSLRTIQNGSEFSPVITPVVDLSGAKSSLIDFNRLFDNVHFAPTVSTNVAESVNNQTKYGWQHADDGSMLGRRGDVNISLSQTNTSPKALSTTEIYRNTKNALSQAKEAAGL